jgi:carbonic anhydrase
MTDPSPRSWVTRALRRDLPASFVVFLVAVPLSLGIALASNAPIMAGLIAAVVGGVVVGALSGAPLQVSGPAAGLVVLVFDLTERLGGDWRAVCAVIALAGVIQLALGAARVARLALAISPAVVHGMLAGIGVLIALGQLHVVLGGKPMASALDNLRTLPAQVLDVHGATAGLGLLTIVLLAGLALLPTSSSLRRVPAPLVAVTVATLASIVLSLDVARIDLALDDHAHAVSAGVVLPDGPDAPRGDEGLFLDALALPAWPDLPPWEIAFAALALALVASVESLLCAVATDKMHPGAKANLDRELMAQGVGNTVSGLLGGLPVTGVIVRSSANIAAGAETRASAVLHGLWVLLFVALLPFVIEAIPKSVLAALLVFIGVRLVNLHHARDLKKHGELSIYLITIAGVVFIDLLSGVGLGVACAVLRLVWRLAHVRVEVIPGAISRIRVVGALTFLGVPKLLAALGRVPAGQPVRVDLALTGLDHAGWEALDGWRHSHERGGGTVHMDGFPSIWRLEKEEDAPAAPSPELALAAAGAEGSGGDRER